MTMPARPANFTEAHSSGILRVSQDTNARRLAAAIMQVAKEQPRLKVRAAGMGAVNVAVKAIIIAGGEAYRRGRAFLIQINFDVVTGTNDDEVTIIVFDLVLVDRATIGSLYEHPATTG